LYTVCRQSLAARRRGRTFRTRPRLVTLEQARTPAWQRGFSQITSRLRRGSAEGAKPLLPGSGVSPVTSLLLARHRRRHASDTRKVTQKDGLVELASQTAEVWEVYSILSEAEFQQCTQAGIEPILAQLLHNRTITTPAEMRAF